MRYKNREQAAIYLINYLESKKVSYDMVFGLPRGGLIVAKIIACFKKLPLDYILLKKIGPPGNPEYAIAVTTLSGQLIRDSTDLIYNLPKDYFEKTCSVFRKEMLERDKKYRKYLKKTNIQDKTILLVDDGIATGLTMQAAISDLYYQGALEVIVASPVGSKEAIEKLRLKVNQVYVPYIPEYFFAVGEFYTQFDPVSDDEIIKILREVKEDGRIKS